MTYEHEPTRPKKLRNAAVVGTAALVGVTLGTGGASLALWSDEEEFSGEISSGYEYFAAGHADGDITPASSGTASVSIGADEAITLVDEEEIAIPLQAESLSQGNKGLTYEVIEPDWGDNVFGAAAVSIFPVDSVQGCAVEEAPEDPADLTSTPVSSEYSATEDPTVEYWCLVATLDELPGQGSYENIGSVTATAPNADEVTDSDEWDAVIGSNVDPADESDHDIEFSYTTFRPGAQTP